jgi:hypothetical protein
MLPSHPPSPSAPRRVFPRASFSAQSNPQRTPLGKRAVLAAQGWAGEECYASGSFSPLALPEAILTILRFYSVL